MKNILLIAIILSCSGCAYATDRLNDFADCFHFDVGYGAGLEAHFVATDALSYCIGVANPTKYGMRGRYIGKWEDTYDGFPMANLFIAYAMTQADSSENATSGSSCLQWGCFLLPWPVYSRIIIGETPDSSFPSVEYWSIIITTNEMHRGVFGDVVNAFDFDAGFTVIYFGMNAGFSLGQFADFVLGFFGFDIAGDDKKETRRVEPGG